MQAPWWRARDPDGDWLELNRREVAGGDGIHKTGRIDIAKAEGVCIRIVLVLMSENAAYNALPASYVVDARHVRFRNVYLASFLSRKLTIFHRQ